mmetsp:Transcript_20192/g.45092  ORF Transcript_20192/g.45092 Transcript_20192/m.45092 type:complete len:394 (-) Transcript_20192:499-1680(-)|eukprot:CAMPEP_0181242052 /NCGR_PEP_ID=MMETSP1096-20121128/41466_1 /TAXON_ID=156174 ORGANISM="Chrysochromulina ericina, Strain CCMP281" /NCGR_SAMPLE_ID=MMETSP1096 /ASSEMBLY_ACC=CAM_ASM_000453 /LENGTH=393 /DNA_ID=CAMNT_0023338199 /DNA_START=64 /DNA_END=1245 /DNA_ORIENTATION=-
MPPPYYKLAAAAVAAIAAQFALSDEVALNTLWRMLRVDWPRVPASSRALHSSLQTGRQPALERHQPASDSSTVANDDHLRCGQPILVQSFVKTHGVEVRAHSRHLEGNNGGYSWRVGVEIHNGGAHAVTLLTVQWIIVDASGKVSHVQGPILVGVAPLLRPGKTWQFENRTTLPTPAGAVHGSFALEAALEAGDEADTEAGQLSLSGVMGRLALSATNGAEVVPCGPFSSAPHVLSPISLQATRRVAIGTRLRYIGKAAGMRNKERPQARYSFGFQAQIDNARDAPLMVLAHEWRVVDADGHTRVALRGFGAGGGRGSSYERIAARGSLTIKGVLTAATPSANAYARFTVREELEGTVNEPFDVASAAVGVSASGEAVADLIQRQPLGSSVLL